MRVVGEFGPDEIRVRAGRARLATAAFVVMNLAFWALVRDGDFGLEMLLVVPIYFVVGVADLVAWVKWFHAVHDVVVAVDRARFRGAWWLWVWVVPGVSWVIPKMMLNDLWTAARSIAGPRTQPVLINVWWATNVASGIAFYLGRDEFGSLQTIGWVAWIVTYFLTIWVIPQVTEVALLTQDAYQRASIEPPSMGITQPVT